MAGINKVILVGNLGADPEIRTLDSGVKVGRINLATNEPYRDKNGQWQESVEWHNVVLWRYNAEKAEKFLSKGSQVYVEGKLKTRKWTDKDDNTRYTTEVEADRMILLGSKNDNQQSGNYQSSDQQQSQAANQQASAPEQPKTDDVNLPSKDEAEDDLPF